MLHLKINMHNELDTILTYNEYNDNLYEIYC